MGGDPVKITASGEAHREVVQKEPSLFFEVWVTARTIFLLLR
jgi:hypothetical protein